MVDQELIAAARFGEAEVVRGLLEQGASVTARDPAGASALVAAAYGNHVEVAPAPRCGPTSTQRTRPSRART